MGTGKKNWFEMGAGFGEVGGIPPPKFGGVPLGRGDLVRSPRIWSVVIT